MEISVLDFCYDYETKKFETKVNFDDPENQEVCVHVDVKFNSGKDTINIEEIKTQAIDKAYAFLQQIVKSRQ